MPEYKCKSCGEKFQVLRNPQDKEKELKCPKCGSVNTERVYSLRFG